MYFLTISEIYNKRIMICYTKLQPTVCILLKEFDPNTLERIRSNKMLKKRKNPVLRSFDVFLSCVKVNLGLWITLGKRRKIPGHLDMMDTAGSLLYFWPICGAQT